MIERPLDYLNSLKGQRILIKLRGTEVKIIGKLLAFDIHINLVLEKERGIIEFIKGDNILSIGQ